MARPSRCRRICAEPVYDSFAPCETSCKEQVVLTVDEYETIRLIDYEKQTHEQCAAQMDISRTTVTEIYERARFKIADSIVNGKLLRITGGNYRLCNGSMGHFCKKTCNYQKGEISMKIAVTYENGMIFQHFGHTEYFKIYTVENNAVTGEEVVATLGSGHGALAGFLTEHGVNVLICGGIGAGAQNALAAAGIQLFGGVTGSADEAVNALLGGKLMYNPDVHCSHHAHEHSCGEHHCGEDKHGCGGNH